MRGQELIYLYCVTKDKPSHCNFGDIGVKTYPIYFQGTYAIVGKVSPEDFSEDNLKKNLADMGWVEKKVRLHERIIEESMRKMTIIPFKFATIFETDNNVEKLLKERNADFKKLITNLEGKEEWGLKIYCDLEKFNHIALKEDESIKKIDKEIESSGKGKAYLLQKKKEGLAKDVTGEKIAEYTKDSFDRLKRVSIEAKINKLLPKEVTERKDEMVFNGAFLVNKKMISGFNNVLDYLKTKYSDKGLSFDCTGPWPPYNFCDFKEKCKNERSS